MYPREALTSQEAVSLTLAARLLVDHGCSTGVIGDHACQPCRGHAHSVSHTGRGDAPRTSAHINSGVAEACPSTGKMDTLNPTLGLPASMYPCNSHGVHGREVLMYLAKRTIQGAMGC